MMRFCSLSAVILLASPFLFVDGQTQTIPECGANQHFDTCGTACPANCSNFREPLICTDECKIGCFCNSGYVFHSTIPKLCVERNQCPIKKGLHACEKPFREFNECGSACPRTCANRNQLFGCKKLCVPGCFCKKGYLSNSNGRCIPVSACGD